MFKIKRISVIAIYLSLVLLAGCGQKAKPPVPVFSSDTSQSSGYTGSTSSASSTGSVSSSEERSSAESSAVSSSTSEPDITTELPESDTQTVTYCLDPNNPCSVTFDGESITVTGTYGDVLNGVKDIYPKMNITSLVVGDRMTCVLTPKTTGYTQAVGSFAILDKSQHQNVVHIDLSEGSLMFPDVSDIARNNDRTASSVTEASRARVAQYITLDGSRDRIPEILDEIQRISDEICEGIDSDYEKLRAISRWVSDNIYYDHPAYNKGAPQECLSLEYMLLNRASVCGGYSNMTSALCAAQGIRCLNISGMAVNNQRCFLQDRIGGFHEWNVAEIDGKRIIIDAGWNSGNSLQSNGTLSSKPSYYHYFDIGEEVFALNHKAQSAEYRDYFSLI